MKPVVTSRDIREYNKNRRRVLCTCNVRCDNIVTIVLDETVIVLCEKGATEFSYSIMQEVGTVVKMNKYRGNIWTDTQILELKNYVQSFGVGKLPQGALRHFANEHGKTREQVKQKVTYLKSIGDLPYLRDQLGTTKKK